MLKALFAIFAEHFKAYRLVFCIYALSKLTFLLKTMFKEEYPQGTQDYLVQGENHPQIICLWLVGAEQLWLASGIIAGSRVYMNCVRTKQHDV